MNSNPWPEILRKRKKTQKSCAQEVGVSASTWSSWEAGKRRPREQYFSKISQALGVTEKELEILYAKTILEGHGVPATEGLSRPPSLREPIDRLMGIDLPRAPRHLQHDLRRFRDCVRNLISQVDSQMKASTSQCENLAYEYEGLFEAICEERTDLA